LDILNYINLCRNALAGKIEAYDTKDFFRQKDITADKRKTILDTMDKHKNKLKYLLSQKLSELAANTVDEKLINEIYSELLAEIMDEIKKCELKLKELDHIDADKDIRGKMQSGLQLMDAVIKKGNINRMVIEILIEKVIVDKDGLPEIKLKYGFDRQLSCSPAEELNHNEHEIIRTVLRLIQQEKRPYTSVKYLLAGLTLHGYKKTVRAVYPYIRLMIDLGILKETKDRLKPYEIVVSKEALSNRMDLYMESVSNRWYASNGS